MVAAYEDGSEMRVVIERLAIVRASSSNSDIGSHRDLISMSPFEINET
jgi:hypothetical protein